MDSAILDYLTLVHLLHDVLMQQVDLDVVSLETAIQRSLADRDRQDIITLQQQAHRWAFLCSGVTHPNFLRVLGDISPTGKAKVVALAKDWS